MYFYSLIRNIIIQITKSPTTDPSTEDKVDHRQKLLKLEKRETRKLNLRRSTTKKHQSRIVRNISMERQYRLNKIGSQDMGWVLLLIFASPHSFLYRILLANVDHFYSNILFIFYCQKNTCQNRYYIVKVD